MTIDCPLCGKRVAVVAGELAAHEAPVNVSETKTQTIGVYVRCCASLARVEVHRRRRA